MLRVQKVRLRFLRDPVADQLPVPNGRGCNERGWELVLRFDSIRNLFRIDRRKEREIVPTRPVDSALAAFFCLWCRCPRDHHALWGPPGHGGSAGGNCSVPQTHTH